MQAHEALISPEHVVHSRVPVVQRRSKNRVADTLESVDVNVVDLVAKIPYNAWGGAINMATSRLIHALSGTNYRTIVAVCVSLLEQPDGYWKDNRDRDFSGISEAIEKRLEILGYDITDIQVRHYMSSSSMKRISIPANARKRGD